MKPTSALVPAGLQVNWTQVESNMVAVITILFLNLGKPTNPTPNPYPNLTLTLTHLGCIHDGIPQKGGHIGLNLGPIYL